MTISELERLTTRPRQPRPSDGPVRGLVVEAPGQPRPVPLSVWPTGQRSSAAQRGDRYVARTVEHPARMWPAVAAYAIEYLTEPGQLVFDPMCGAGTTLVEALCRGRDAVGVELEPGWASLARDNVEHIRRRGIGGDGHVITADSRALPEVLPVAHRERMRDRVALLLTSPPYGPRTHGQVKLAPTGQLTKSWFRYTPTRGVDNLAHQRLDQLLAGLTRILRGSLPLLAPTGHVVLATRPWHEHGRRIDLPAAVTAAAAAAGLVPVQRCAALLAGVSPAPDTPGGATAREQGDSCDSCDGARWPRLISRASFFQRLTVSKARAAGLPRALTAHEDILIFRPARSPQVSAQIEAEVVAW